MTKTDVDRQTDATLAPPDAPDVCLCWSSGFYMHADDSLYACVYLFVHMCSVALLSSFYDILSF